MLWTKLNNAELKIFVASIKVDYCRSLKKYTEILQEMATQIPTSKTPPFTMAWLLELNTGGNNERNTSAYPAEGAIFPYDTIYTGSYPYKQWVSSAVTPNHDEIREIWEEGKGEHKSNNYKKGRQQKRKVSELRSQILELDLTKQRLISDLVNKSYNSKPTGGVNGSLLGTSFVGRPEKANKWQFWCTLLWRVMSNFSTILPKYVSIVHE